jgi:hypothetical protein
VGGGVDICEPDGVGVRDFGRVLLGIWAEGGGVMLLVAFSTRCTCSLATPSAVSLGMLACDGWGVMGAPG